MDEGTEGKIERRESTNNKKRGATIKRETMDARPARSSPPTAEREACRTSRGIRIGGKVVPCASFRGPRAGDDYVVEEAGMVQDKLRGGMRIAVHENRETRE